MWKLALRNVFRHKTRTLITLAAIVFGVAALILSSGFVGDFFVQLRESTIHSQFGHLQIYKHGYYKFGRRAPYEYMINNPDQKLTQLGRLEHVTDVTSRVNFSGLLSNGRTTFPISGEGVDPEKEAKLATYLAIKSGTPLTKEQPYTIVVGQGVAKSLKLQVGDNATILVNTREGALNSVDFTVVGIFQTFSKEYDDQAVRIPMTAAQELLATKAVHSLVLALDDTANTDHIATILRRFLPGNEFDVKTWYELADFYGKAVDLYRRYFVVLRIIILGMVFLGVANSVNMTIFERAGEIGTLMALGDRRSKVFNLLIAENIILGAIGASAGVIFGVSVALAVSAIGIPMPPMPNTNTGYIAHIQIVPAECGLAFLIGFSATVLAALWPAGKASRLPVIAALARN